MESDIMNEEYDYGTALEPHVIINDAVRVLVYFIFCVGSTENMACLICV